MADAEGSTPAAPAAAPAESSSSTPTPTPTPKPAAATRTGPPMDKALFIYTSLTAGSSHIVTATSRMETILRANRIPFKALDLATDSKARILWSRRAGKDAKGRARKLPALIQLGLVVGDLPEIEEWNEYGELRQHVKIYYDDFTIPTKAEAAQQRNLLRRPYDPKPNPNGGPVGGVKLAEGVATSAAAAASAAAAKAAAGKSAASASAPLVDDAAKNKENLPIRSVAEEAAQKAKEANLAKLREKVHGAKKDGSSEKAGDKGPLSPTPASGNVKKEEEEEKEPTASAATSTATEEKEKDKPKEVEKDKAKQVKKEKPDEKEKVSKEKAKEKVTKDKPKEKTTSSSSLKDKKSKDKDKSKKEKLEDKSKEVVKKFKSTKEKGSSAVKGKEKEKEKEKENGKDQKKDKDRKVKDKDKDQSKKKSKSEVPAGATTMNVADLGGTVAVEAPPEVLKAVENEQTIPEVSAEEEKESEGKVEAEESEKEEEEEESDEEDDDDDSEEGSEENGDGVEAKVASEGKAKQ